MIALSIAYLFGSLGASFLECRALSLKGLQRVARLLERSVDFGRSRLHLAQRARIGLGQGLQFGVKAFAALGQSLGCTLEVSAIRLLELQAALRLHQLAARLAQPLLGGAECLLGLRQARLL